MVGRTGSRRFSARPISSGARRSTSSKVGLTLSPETIKNHLLFECGDGTTLLVYGAADPNQADHTQVRFWSDDVAADVAELEGRGVTFEEYDFPMLKTVDGIATTAGSASPRGSRTPTATRSRCSSPNSRTPGRVRASRSVRVRRVSVPRRILGRTGVEVGVLGYGAMEIRGGSHGPAIEDAEAGRLLNAVLDGGIDLIDTSIDYGRSEELIGRFLADRRDEFFLASKCGCMLELPDDATPPYPHDFSAANVRAGVEQSLRRLRTDRLDLVQVHMSPSREQMDAEGTIEEMMALRAEGKVRFLGISGTLPNLAEQIEMGVFDVFQIPYSAVQRECEDLVSAAAAAGAGVLVRGGVARGAPSEDKAWGVQTIGLGEGEAQRRWELAQLDDLLDGMSRHEFVLRFTLSHPGLSSTIVGTSRPAHLESNLAIAAKGPLPPDLYEEAKRRLPTGLSGRRSPAWRRGSRSPAQTESRHAIASAPIAADSSLGRIGFVVKRSHGVHGAVVRARVAALSTSSTAKPPFPPAKP